MKHMRKMKLTLILVVGIIIASPSLSSQASSSRGTVKQLSIENLQANVLTLKKGTSFRLKPKIIKSGRVSTKVVYKSSNKNVVTVSKKGRVTAKKKGKAKIIVIPKANKKKRIIIFVRVGTPVKAIKLNKSYDTLTVGETMALTSRILPKKPQTKKSNG